LARLGFGEIILIDRKGRRPPSRWRCSRLLSALPRAVDRHARSQSRGPRGRRSAILCWYR